MIQWHYPTSSRSGSQFYCFCLGQIIRSKFSWFRLGLLISYKYAQHAHLRCPMMRKVSKVSRNVASLNIVVHDVINLLCKLNCYYFHDHNFKRNAKISLTTQNSRKKEGTILIHLHHSHSFANIQKFIFSFTSDMTTFYY